MATDTRNLTFHGRASLIAIIGNDGAGKSTQVRRLAEWLERQGRTSTLHPNESLQPIKAALEAIALDEGLPDPETLLGLDTSQLVYAAIKWNTMIKVLDRLTAPGHFVIMDRYSYCHVASVRSQGIKCAGVVERLFQRMPPPDLTLLLDVSPDTALARMARRGDTSRRMTRDYLEAHARAYRALPESGRFVTVNGEPPPDEVALEIQHHVRRTFDL